MPETRSDNIEVDAQEILDHWALQDEARAELGKAARDLHVDLRNGDTFEEVFNVERLHHFPGTLDQAKRVLSDWAIAREHAMFDRLAFDTPEHQEARAIAWTYVIAPDGTQINVTSREGSSPDMITATVLALTGSIRQLGELGFVTQKNRK